MNRGGTRRAPRWVPSWWTWRTRCSDPWADDGDDDGAEDWEEQAACPRCGTPAVLCHLKVRRGEIEVREGRGFNALRLVRCDACGLNADDFPSNPFKPAGAKRPDEEDGPMTRVYGSTIEPGGMELDDETEEVPCPRCGEPAVRRRVELCECGSINCYDFTRCRACGYLKGDVPDTWAERGWFDPEDARFAVPPADEDDAWDEPEPDRPEPGPSADRREEGGLPDDPKPVERRRGRGAALAVYSAGLLLLGTALGLSVRRTGR